MGINEDLGGACNGNHPSHLHLCVHTTVLKTCQIGNIHQYSHCSYFGCLTTCYSILLNTPVFLKGFDTFAAVRNPGHVILIEEPNEPTASVSRKASRILFIYSQGNAPFYASGQSPRGKMAYTALRTTALK
jgi:hypothetical protein